jgi:hypothetical protein
MGINVDKFSEGIDYELIPVDCDNEQAWEIRINRTFPETIIRYGKVKFDGIQEVLKFDFMVVKSPDENLTSENEELQDVAGEILQDILERAANEGWLYDGNGEPVGNKTRTNDTEELTH